MEREKQEAIIEAVLFTMGESVEISKLAELIEETKGNTKKIVYAMKEKLQQENRGIEGKNRGTEECYQGNGEEDFYLRL